MDTSFPTLTQRGSSTGFAMKRLTRAIASLLVLGTGGSTYAAQIEEIIVTATKSAESASSVPLSIAAISGDNLKSQQISSVADLSRMVPALSVTSSTFGTDVYNIRGVGFYESTLAAVPTVSVYVDEVPLPFSVMTPAASLDPERVEVLMGPQGTLFGQNSTGGAINYVAASPTEAFEASVTGTVGNYDTHNLDGYLSGPVAETLGARFSFRSQNSTEGWQKSATRGDKHGDVDKQQGRLLLKWAPADHMSFTVNLNGFLDKSDTQAAQMIATPLNFPVLAGFVPDLVGAPRTDQSSTQADWDQGIDFDKNNKFWQVGTRLEVELTNTLTLTNILAYSKYDHDQTQDLDGLALENFRYRILGDIESINEELRLSGDLSDSDRFVAGLSYSTNSVFQREIGYEGYNTTSFAPTIFFGLPRFHDFQDVSNQDNDTWGIFGSVDHDFSDEWTAHVGVRYTESSTDFDECVSGDAGITGFVASTNPPGECLTHIVSNGLLSGKVEDSLDEENVAWRVGVDYKPSADVLIYGNISRGFKSGSFPVLAAAIDTQLRPVTQEKLTAYELGVKAAVADLPLRVSSAVFYYEYKDKQIRGSTPAAPFGLLETLLNIPDSEVRGVEGNVQWQPIDGLNVSGGFSYIDTEIKGFSTYDILSNFVDLDGEHFPNAPSMQSNIATTYDWVVGSSTNAFVGFDYRYSSSTNGALGNIDATKIPSYGLWGAKLGLRDAEDRWNATLWVKNLTDEEYLVGAYRGGDALLSFAGMPKTYGLSLTYKFD